jgi:hypothetical protein
MCIGDGIGLDWIGIELICKAIFKGLWVSMSWKSVHQVGQNGSNGCLVDSNNPPNIHPSIMVCKWVVATMVGSFSSMVLCKVQTIDENIQ